MCVCTKIRTKGLIFMHIVRDTYLEKLKKSKDNGLIKVITGQEDMGHRYASTGFIMKD